MGTTYEKTTIAWATVDDPVASVRRVVHTGSDGRAVRGIGRIAHIATVRRARVQRGVHWAQGHIRLRRRGRRQRVTVQRVHYYTELYIQYK